MKLNKLKRLNCLLILVLLLMPPLTITALAQDVPTDVSAWQTQVVGDALAMTATAVGIAPVADTVVESIEATDEPVASNDPTNVSVTINQTPTTAPTAAPVADNSELYILITSVVAIVAVAATAYLKEKQGKPSEAALSYQDSLNRAVTTPGIYDESMLQFWLMIRGFPVERLPDGSFKVSPPPPSNPN